MSETDRSSPSEIVAPAALLLAAGLSTRMGAENKLLAEIGGEPMVRCAARLLLDYGLETWVVTGHEREAVEAVLDGLDVRFVHNDAFADGQRTSVRAGLRAIAAMRPAPVLVALADQPWLEQQDIDKLVEAFSQTPRDAFLVPWFGDKRGNPVIVPEAIVAEIAGGTSLPERGPLTDGFPGRVRRWEAPNDHFLRDIDTAEALAHFRRE